MKKTNIIFQRDLKELGKTNAFFIILMVFAVVTIAAAIIISIVLSKQEWLDQAAARPLLELIISLTAYFLLLFILITFIWSFASLPIIKEKVSGVISSLLATPLSPGEILIGKSLAIFFPGFIISIISTFITLLVINLAAVKPATGNIVLPLPALFTGLVTNSLLFSGLTFFIVLFSLANNPDVAIAPSFVIAFGLMMGIPLGMAIGKINLASWSFSIWYLGGVVLFWIVILCFLKLLTKENIILSQKGE